MPGGAHRPAPLTRSRVHGFVAGTAALAPEGACALHHLGPLASRTEPSDVETEPRSPRRPSNPGPRNATARRRRVRQAVLRQPASGPWARGPRGAMAFRAAALR